MNQSDIIAKTKAKLEEISPFEEPNSLAIAGSPSDTSYAKVKPIISYIEECIAPAAEFCLSVLPASLLAEDIELRSEVVDIDNDGVGKVRSVNRYYRFLRISAGSDFERDITSFITSQDPSYLIQQNKYTRGGYCKPVAVYVPEHSEIEIYSFGQNRTSCSDTIEVAIIATRKPIQYILSPIEDYVALKCAALVYDIFGNTNGSKIMMDEFVTKSGIVLK